MDNIAPSTSAPKRNRMRIGPRALQVRQEARRSRCSHHYQISPQLTSRPRPQKVRSLSTLASVTESIDDAVEVLNEALSRKHTSAQIRKDEELNRFLVTIKDKDSGEIVREVPPEALLKFARNLEELKGILFDETL